MHRILTLNQIAPKGLARLPADRFTVGGDVVDPDAILVRSQQLTMAHVTPNLRAVARAGAGTNNVPVTQYTEHGIVVFNTPGANANSVKELTVAAMLLASRGVVEGMQFVAAADPRLDHAGLHALLEREKKRFKGNEVAGRSLGVVGLGAIGSLVAQAALHLGMEVLGYDPALSVDAAWRLPSSVRKANSIEELLKQSDFVTLHVPLVPATRNLIDAKRLAAMKSGAVLLNFARDALVDEEAIVAALRAHRLKHYLCDFPSASLIREPGVVALPHLGASTEEAEENCAVMVVDQVREYLENGAVANAVNFPNVEMAREAPFRVAIANANVPNMLGQISTAMARAGLNIHNMVNKSRGEMAFTLVDTDSPVDDAAVEAIAAIEGVLSVRAIPQSAAG